MELPLSAPFELPPGATFEPDPNVGMAELQNNPNNVPHAPR
jgi:hypothetical protein